MTTSQGFSQPSTTSGLSSAYQVTEVTGDGLSQTTDTGGMMPIAGRQRYAPKQFVEIIEIMPDRKLLDFAGNDPAHTEFAGPLGMPSSHADLAHRLQSYRPVAEENYDDIAEDIP